jgi:hypothetical protein
MSPTIEAFYLRIAQAASAHDWALVDSIAIAIAALTKRYILANKD